MIEQYNQYHVKQINKYVNGYQTLGENIADNAGLSESFKVK